jgi:uncharacterized protein (TIGR02058 family)
MTDQRFIIEMGMGNDQYGMDYTKAAARAIEDAIRHSSIPLFDATGLPHEQMRVQVRAEVTAVEGGLNVTNPDSGATLVIASAAVEAFLPRQA